MSHHASATKRIRRNTRRFDINHARIGRIDAAITALEDARNRNGNALPVRLHLAASYVQADRLGDAEWEVKEILVLNPSETISLQQLSGDLQVSTSQSWALIQKYSYVMLRQRHWTSHTGPGRGPYSGIAVTTVA